MLKRIAIGMIILVLMLASFILGNLTATPETIHDAAPVLQTIKPQLHKAELPWILKS